MSPRSRAALRFVLLNVAAGALSALGAEIATRLKQWILGSKSPELEAIEELQDELAEVRGALRRMEAEGGTRPG